MTQDTAVKKDDFGDFGDFTSLQTSAATVSTEDSSFTNFSSSEIPSFPAFEDSVRSVEPSAAVTKLSGNGFSVETKESEDKEEEFGSFDSAQFKDNSAATVSGETAVLPSCVCGCYC